MRQKVGGRRKGVRDVGQIDDPVAIGIDPVSHDVAGQELGVADFAMHRPDGVGRQGAGIDQFQGCHSVPAEKFASAAVIGQGRNGRDDVAVAHAVAKPRFHPVNRDDDRGRHAKAAFQPGVEIGVPGDPAAALADDGIGTPDPHEFFQRITERPLVAVGGDRPGGILRTCKGGQPALADALGRSLGSELLFPAFEPAGVIAALRSKGGCRRQRQGGGGKNGPEHYVAPKLISRRA